MIQIAPLVKKAITFLQLDFDFISKAKDVVELAQCIVELKKKAKKKFKELSKQFHPDLGGDEEKMKELLSHMDIINKLRIIKPQPRPQFSYRFYYSNPFANSTATSYTTTFNGYNTTTV